MNPLDLIEAIGEMDEEWIRLCRDDVTEPEAVTEHKEICMTPSKAEPEPDEEYPEYTNKPPGTALWSYLMTAGCTAACICGMALLIRFVNAGDEFSIQTSKLDSSFSEVMPVATTVNPETTIVSDITTVSGTEIRAVTTDRNTTGTTASANRTAQHTETAVQTTAEQTHAAAENRSDTTPRTSAAGSTRPQSSANTTTTRTTTTAAAPGTARNTTTRLTTTPPAATTTTTTAAPVPDILLQHCRTLVDGRPLWSEYRALTYHDGLEYMSQTVFDGRTQNDTPFELTGMYLEIGCAQGAPGDTVTVPVYIAGVPDLIGLTMFIDPPAGLEPVAITSTLGEDFDLPYAAGFDAEPYAACFTNGSFVFAESENIHPQDGYLLAYYSYRIPEDAQPGTVYPVCINAEKTEFGAYSDAKPDYDYDHDGELNEEEYLAAVLGLNNSFLHYQYTHLSGVIVVE